MRHFACYRSTDHEIGLDFHTFLQGYHTGYCINEDSLNYLRNIRFPDEKILLFKLICGTEYVPMLQHGSACLKDSLGITGANHVRGSTGVQCQN